MNEEPRGLLAPPCAVALIESLRSLGYNLPAAVADLVDNSVSAHAQNVRVEYDSDPGSGWVAVVDDGQGMDEERLHRAMRLGVDGPAVKRLSSDLGRFGMGMKTASFSQARRLTVLTRTSEQGTACRTWDLEYVARRRDWYVIETVEEADLRIADQLGLGASGTMVLWRDLDRCGYGRSLTDGMSRARDHLGAVFGRFVRDGRLRLSLGGQSVRAWDPFMLGHPATQDLGSELLEGGLSATGVTPYVLPHPSRLTEVDARVAAGSAGWSTHQGFFVYRGDRMLTSGGWLGLQGLKRGPECQLARIAVDIGTDDDHAWQVDIRKARVNPPSALRGRLTEIATLARTRSEQVFRHRGVTLSHRRGSEREPLTFVWQQNSHRGQLRYRINRAHPTITAALSGAERSSVEAVLRLIEETLPIGLIAAEATLTPNATPQAPLDKATPEEVEALFRAALANLPADPGTRDAVTNALRSTEPFNRFPDVLTSVLEGGGVPGVH